MKTKPTNDTNRPAKKECHLGDRLQNAMEDMLNEFCIFEYSRAEAVQDGALIDVTALARDVGFRYPVTLTAAAWGTCVSISRNDDVHDARGRLWDVLNVL